MALRNRTLQEETKLKGADRARDSTKFKLGQFETLKNWIPAHVYSIKKKRGVELLATDPLAPQIPSGCTASPCPTSIPEAQTLDVACCWDNHQNIFGITHGMFAHVGIDDTFWATASLASGSASGPYPDATPSDTWDVYDGGPGCADLVETTPIAMQGGRTANFQSTQTPQAAVAGKSDEKCYVLSLSSISPLVTGAEIANGPGYIGGGSVNNARAYFGETSGCSLYWTSDNGTQPCNRGWVKAGDKIYAPTGGASVTDYATWPCPGVSYEDYRNAIINVVPDYVAEGLADVTRWIAADVSTNYVWLLMNANSGYKVYQIDRTTLNYVADWLLDPTGFADRVFQFEVINDDFIFILGDDSPTGFWHFGYWIPSNPASIFHIGQVTAGTCAGTAADFPTNQNSFIYRRGYFYLGYSGFSLGRTNVVKIGPLVCPTDPTIIIDPAGEL